MGSNWTTRTCASATPCPTTPTGPAIRSAHGHQHLPRLPQQRLGRPACRPQERDHVGAPLIRAAASSVVTTDRVEPGQQDLRNRWRMPCRQDRRQPRLRDRGYLQRMTTTTQPLPAAQLGSGCHDTESTYGNRRLSPEQGLHVGPLPHLDSKATYTGNVECVSCHDGNYAGAPDGRTTVHRQRPLQRDHHPAGIDTNLKAGGTQSATCNDCHNATSATTVDQLFAQHQGIGGFVTPPSRRQLHRWVRVWSFSAGTSGPRLATLRRLVGGTPQSECGDADQYVDFRDGPRPPR